METPSKVWTVSELLHWATSDFSAKGFSEGRLSAEILLSKALNTGRVGLYLKYDQAAAEGERAEFRRMVEERRKGMPVAYIVGEKEFYSLPFYVDPRVLVPRPETELLVDEVISYVGARNMSQAKICDVGTGSGAIAIALKKSLRDATVLGVDVSREALQVAAENARRNDVNIQWAEGNLLHGVDRSYRIVVANLPYLSSQEYENLSLEVKGFEPKLALHSGETGLEMIERLIKELATFDSPSAIFLEIGMGQEQSVQKLFAENGFTLISIRKDYSGIPRILSAEK